MKKLALVLALLGVALPGSPSRAADGTWNIDALGNWNTAGNWSPTAIPGGTGSTVNLTFNITAARTVTIDTTSATVGILNVGDPTSTIAAYTLAASGGASLIMDNGGSGAQINHTNTGGADIISTPISLGDHLAVSNASASLLTLSGGITGNKNLTVNANSTGGITLSTASVNNGGTITNSGTGTGTTTISGGVGSNVTAITQNSTTSALTISTNALNVNSGGTTLTNSSGTKLLTVSGGVAGTGNLVLNNNSSTAGGITISTTSLNNTGTILNSGSGSGSAVVSAVIGTNVTGVTQNSATSQLTLSGANTYTGTYTVSAGTLSISNATSFTNAGGFSLASGARLDVAATNANLSKLSTANGGSGVVAGSILRYSADQTAAGAASGPGTILGTVELNGGNVRPNYTMDFGGGSKLINLVSSNFTPTSTTLSGNVTFETTTGTTLTVANGISGSTSGLKTLTLTGSGTGSATGAITSGSGSIQIIKEGTGSWSIGNAGSDNVLLGGVIINEGSLTMARSTTTAGTTTTAANIPTVFLGDTALSNTKSATLVLNSTSNSINFDPAITVRSGSSGLLKITRNGAGANFSSIRGGIALNNNVTLDGGSVAGQGLTVSTIAISGTGNVTTDNAVRFTVANTYNGTTTINSGTLSAGVADALPDTALAVNSGATFDMSLTNATFNQRVAGLSDGTGGGGTIVGNSINTANSGNIQNRTLTLDGTGGTYAFSGIIMDKPLANTTANSNLALAKSGNSSQALSGVNTYTGSTTVSGGTLLINGAGSINGTSGVAVNGGIFNYASSTGLSANVTVAGGNFKYNSSSNYTGSLTFTSGTLGGTNLNGVNLTGANAIGSGKVLSPGNSPGTLQVDDVAFGNGGAYLWEINDLSLAQGGTAGTKGGNPGWDWIDGTGNALDLTGLGANGFTLQIDSLNALNGWNANGSYSWVIATFGSINGFNAGNFVLDSSAFGDQNSLNGSFSLGVSGNDLVLSYAAVPEPSTYTLFALGLGALLALRRKQRRS